MELVALVLVTAAIFVWGAVSARLERADLSAPIVFTLVGRCWRSSAWSTRPRRRRL